MTRIKICGITNKTDAALIAQLNADLMGFIFYEKSKRFVDPATARDIISELPLEIARVGVFVDASEESMRSIAEDVGLDTIQLHGHESPELCSILRKDYKVIKAFRPRRAEDLKQVNDYDSDYILLDAYRDDLMGGTGEIFDWNILKNFEFLKPVILSGGLNPSNIAGAIREVAPYGVDVASGVEKSPGKKDPGLLKKFIEEVRKSE